MQENDSTRRSEYERVAEGLCILIEMQISMQQGVDIPTSSGIGEGTTLEFALLEHFNELMTYADFFNPETIRKFYVELRLHGDAQQPQPRQPMHKDMLALWRVCRVLDRAQSMGMRYNPLPDREIVDKVIRAVFSSAPLQTSELLAVLSELRGEKERGAQ